MNGPRITGERLRNYLDTNQIEREGMCLALLPLLGQYTQEKPRRPKGGPDGGRDIEAIYDGRILVWGAVGFKNGGGSDDMARKEIKAKFDLDLSRALEEKPDLEGFVFFTNVDLTPAIREQLIYSARLKKVKFVEIFDFELLRHVLDTSEGLIPRLQYLDIEMSKTEQLSLVSKFGDNLQHAITKRLDRVEQTLVRMEKFIDFQIPIGKIEIYAIMDSTIRLSNIIGNEYILAQLKGIGNSKKLYSFLIKIEGLNSSNYLITSTSIWDQDGTFLQLGKSLGIYNILASYSELSFNSVAGSHSLGDTSKLTLNVACTSGIYEYFCDFTLNINGYEIFSHKKMCNKSFEYNNWPKKLSFDAAKLNWVHVIENIVRDFIFDPPNKSKMFSQLNDSMLELLTPRITSR